MEFIVGLNGLNTMRYKTTNSCHKILIFRQTRISPVTDNLFPKVMFQFKSYKEIVAIENVEGVPMFGMKLFTEIFEIYILFFI